MSIFLRVLMNLFLLIWLVIKLSYMFSTFRCLFRINEPDAWIVHLSVILLFETTNREIWVSFSALHSSIKPLSVILFWLRSRLSTPVLACALKRVHISMALLSERSKEAKFDKYLNKSTYYIPKDRCRRPSLKFWRIPWSWICPCLQPLFLYHFA